MISVPITLVPVGVWKLKEQFSCSSNSVKKYDVRYKEYLGDGDTSAFLSVSQSQLRGDELEIDELECIGHVQKRMETRLRKLKQDNTHLPDGKTVSGKALTRYSPFDASAIQKLQLFYGLAVRRNLSIEASMRKAIRTLIMLHHLITTQCVCIVQLIKTHGLNLDSANQLR